jgi:hypothetical protein
MVLVQAAYDRDYGQNDRHDGVEAAAIQLHHLRYIHAR